MLEVPFVLIVFALLYIQGSRISVIHVHEKEPIIFLILFVSQTATVLGQSGGTMLWPEIQLGYELFNYMNKIQKDEIDIKLARKEIW